MLKRLLILLCLASPLWSQAYTNGNISATDSGACTTANACVTLAIPVAAGAVSISLSGTFNATAQFEASNPDGQWVSISGTPLGSTTTATSATAVGVWRFAVSGLTGIRVRGSVYASGTVIVTIQSSPAAASLGGGGAGIGTVTNTSGNLTASQVVVGNGAADLKTLGSLGSINQLLTGNAGGLPTWAAGSQATIANGYVDLSSVQASIAGAKTFTDAAGVTAPKFVATGTPSISGVEGAAASGVASSDIFWPDSAQHRWGMNNNNGGSIFLSGIASAATSAHVATFAANGFDLLDGGAVSALAVAENSVTALAGNRAVSQAANTVTETWNATTGAGVNLVTYQDTTNNTGTGSLLNLNITQGSALTNGLLIQNNPSTAQTLTNLAGVSLNATATSDATHAYNSPPLIFTGKVAHGGADQSAVYTMSVVPASNVNDPVTPLKITVAEGTATGNTGLQVNNIGIGVAPGSQNLRVAQTVASNAGATITAASSPTTPALAIQNNSSVNQIFSSPAAVPLWIAGNNFLLLTSDFTDANASGLQVITGLSLTLPANTAQNYPFQCHLMWTQATVVADNFGIQDVTLAPTRIDAYGTASTAGPATTVTPRYNVLTNLTTTTATSIVDPTPTVTTVNYVDLNGSVVQPSGAASVLQFMVQQATAADVIVVKAGSWCRIW